MPRYIGMTHLRPDQRLESHLQTRSQPQVPLLARWIDLNRKLNAEFQPHVQLIAQFTHRVAAYQYEQYLINHYFDYLLNKQPVWMNQFNQDRYASQVNHYMVENKQSHSDQYLNPFNTTDTSDIKDELKRLKN